MSQTLTVFLLVTLFVLVPSAFAERCSLGAFESLVKKKNLYGQVIVDSVTTMKADAKTQSYCDFRGHVHTQAAHNASEDEKKQQKEIQFRVFLPEKWNQKFLMTGCGGFCGDITLSTDSLSKGYAIASTDTGHFAEAHSDASWAQNKDGTQNLDRLLNYAHRAVHIVAVVSKNVIETRYGSKPKLSYFMGGSNGGRQALMEAQRYPDDFDGIVSYFPALDMPNLLLAFAHDMSAQTPLPGSYVLQKELLPLLDAATMRACDAADGLVDGIISDPENCHFDPDRELPACSFDIAADDCFTQSQIQVVKTIFGPTKVDGLGVVYKGYFPGYENTDGGWNRWLIGDAVQGQFVSNALRYFVYNNPGVKLQDFNLKKNGFDFFLTPSQIALDTAMSAKDPDLLSFKIRGGKLLLIHGWADPALSAASTIDYFKQVQSVMGGANKTSEFARLFLVPGLLHGVIAKGQPAHVDALSTLEAWREKGVAPSQMLGYDGDLPEKSSITRPICAYPQRAAYKGIGSVKEARNFGCH